ncbi:cation transporting ATPase C-terminal domain-containing protein [Leptolyngbya sp. FACHB-261]|uniref:cation transporting ATPase C-terminal domain-containing protein n=1 Tax=Leptolyngbya sp. FACHB-261 TaxID=2692806 RepID=UPI001688378D|nr:cation transporting ATPase C-terminal domain-containing protein [Leptolyngbya sp. FACHB-261]MBD2101290.1 cation-transporting P-type ATPase [Leptolyngbya sp. FACHB-261]
MSTRADPPWHDLDAAQVLALLETRPEGLSKREVRQRSRQQQGSPLSPSMPGQGRLLRRGLTTLSLELRRPSIGLLIAVAAFEWSSQRDSIAGLLLGFAGVQVLRRTLLELWGQSLVISSRANLTPQARVRREQQVQLLPASELVKGDIILLEAGDYVASQIRLLASTDLKIYGSEQTLSSPQQSPPLLDRPVSADQTNLVAPGSVIASGQGLGVVITPSEAALAPVAQPPELLKPVRQIQRWASWGVMLAIALLLFRAVAVPVGNTEAALVFLAALAAVSLPEELVSAAKLSLSLTLRRLARRGLRLRSLSELAALSQVNVCCSTIAPLGQAELRLSELYVPDRSLGLDSIQPDDPQVHQLLLVGTLVSSVDSNLELGQSMAAPLLVAAQRVGIVPAQLPEQFPQIAATPSSPYGLNVTLHQNTEPKAELNSDTSFACLQGPLQQVLPLCQAYWRAGEGVSLGADFQASIEKTAQRMSRWGLRVLAIATAPSATSLSSALWPEGAIFLGLAGFETFNRTSQQELTRVYARSELRLLFVESASVSQTVLGLQAEGARVALLGSQLADITAMQQAHLSLALKSGGADAVRVQAAAVLSDISDLVRFPRAVQMAQSAQRLVESIVFKLLSGQLGLLLLVGLTSLTHLPWPFSTSQLFLLALLSLGTVDLTLAFELGEMRRQKQLGSLKRFSSDFILGVTVIALSLGLVSYAIFRLSYQGKIIQLDHARTLTVCTILWFQWLGAVASRDVRRSLLQVRTYRNPALVLSLLLAALISPLLVYLPTCQVAFAFEPLRVSDWLITLLLGSTAIWIREIFKAFAYND